MPEQSSSAAEQRSAIVVGAGVAGLVAALELARAGWRVTLVEASARLGGKVARHEVAGIELDAGAESFATRGGTVEAYLRSIGLGGSIVRPAANGAWLEQGAASRPLPKTGVLGIPGTPLAADVIAVVGLPAALRAQLDALLGGLAANERSLGRLVRRRMGRGVLERLVTPVAMGIYSKHPDDLDVDIVSPGLRSALRRTGTLAGAVRALREASPAGSAVAGLDGGIFGLVETLETLVRDAGVEVLLSTEVRGADAAGVTLADGTRLSADTVVLATPLAPAALSSNPQPGIVLATLVVDSPALDAAPRGTGLLVTPGTPGVRAKALTHASIKWPWLADRLQPHRHVLRLSYSEPATAGLSDDELLAVALGDASALLGCSIDTSDVLGFARVEWTEPALRGQEIDGVTVVGESVAGTGLAAVIGQAQNQAVRLLNENGV